MLYCEPAVTKPCVVVPQFVRTYVMCLSITENDMFGEFGEYDLVGSGFGGGMEDIEVARDARTDMMEGDTREGAAELQVSHILT